MQFAMLFDAPAQPEPRREKAKTTPRPTADTPCAAAQTALTLAAPTPAAAVVVPAVVVPRPVVSPVKPIPAVQTPVVERPAVAPLPQPSRAMRYVVQAFNRGRHGLVAEPAMAVRDANMACSRAEVLAQRKAGVIAYAMPADAGEDDYPDARILARFGLCPETDE